VKSLAADDEMRAPHCILLEAAKFNSVLKENRQLFPIGHRYFKIRFSRHSKDGRAITGW
jgi:hypothetical protein